MKDEATIKEVSKLASERTPFERVLGGNHAQPIFVELLDPLTAQNSPAAPTPLVAWLQLQAHLLPLQFNRLGSVEQDQLLEIDDRLPLLELKKRLAVLAAPDSVVGASQTPVPLDSFRLLREPEGVQYKDLSRSVALCNLRDVGGVFVESGAPMAAGEFLFRVFLHRPELVPVPGSPAWDAAIIVDPESGEPSNSPEELAFEYLGDVTLRENMSFAEVVSAVAALPQAPPAELMRIRDRRENALTNIWYSDRTLKQNCAGAADRYPLVVQRLAAPEQMRSTDLLLSLRHWIPARLELRPVQELALPKNLRIADLRTRVADLINAELGQQLQPLPSAGSADDVATSSAAAAGRINSDGECGPGAVAPAPAPILTGSDVDVVVANAFELRDVSLLSGLPWQVKLAESATLGGAPWRLRHGDTVLYKLKGHDKLGSALQRADVAARALLSNLQFGSTTAGSGTGAGRSMRGGGGGPELRIFSMDEIAVREQLEIEAQIREQVQRERDAQQLADTIVKLKAEQ
jgi:hypothetical protein